MGTAKMKLENLREVTSLAGKLKSLNDASLVLSNATGVNSEATCTTIRWGTSSIEFSNSIGFAYALAEIIKVEAHGVTEKLLDLGVEVGK
jgi:hypothetical protein